ncbi:MAG TPA: envelope stress response membrane protein PspC [Sphingomicrobium sp.]|jgi:phage shock protein C|nr:envelope stress response membrane protein PspC [Sphingomicrobium sp.]
MAVQPASRTRFYKDKRNGKFMGVCAGIADYTGFDVMLIRILLVLGVVLGGGALIPIYLIAGWISKDRPSELRDSDPEQQRFWQGVRQSPSRSARDIRSTLRAIDRRLADVESYTLSNNRSLAREIDELR